MSISILGSTGSIGTQTLDVARKQGYEIKALCANKSVEKLEKQIREFSPNIAVLSDENAAKDRKENPREGSYTNYLLEKGVDKICKKIGEEASETIIAAKNTDKEELIGEISDLAYHVLVLMLDKDITVEDIKMKLSQRHKIEGKKKQENKKGEY